MPLPLDAKNFAPELRSLSKRIQVKPADLELLRSCLRTR